VEAWRPHDEIAEDLGRRRLVPERVRHRASATSGNETAAQ
jgi:hypothetical protein